MKKSTVIDTILQGCTHAPIQNAAHAFAPTNIALCKYWGKRDAELNLPITSSLSISLGNKGTTTTIQLQNASHDSVFLNQQPIDLQSSFGKRLVTFLDLFRADLTMRFHIDTHSTIPIAAGLASSASGFASLVMALNTLFQWQLPHKELSILARLGSGSASRSVSNGFVEWHAGLREDGMDSYAEAMPYQWPSLCVGLVIFSEQEKPISSREAMQRTVSTSALYSAWPAKVQQDLVDIKNAIIKNDFEVLAKTAESNALAMHATMLAAWPPVSYALPETLTTMQKIWQLRREGLALYFTQDAGPNLKLLFLKKESANVQMHFPTMEIIQPFVIKSTST